MLHEPRGDADLGHDKSIDYRSIFDGAYGEVNSYMRERVEELSWLNRGIILRDPAQILLSAVNRQSEDRWAASALDIVRSYEAFDRLIDSGAVKFINFHRMTADYRYLSLVAKEFGVTDVPVRPWHVRRKRNTNRGARFENLDHIPDIRCLLDPVMYMVAKYGLASTRSASAWFGTASSSSSLGRSRRRGS